MKLLITGIHGFVGSNLVEYLRGKHEIYGLDIVAPEKEGVVKTYSWEDLEQGRVPAVDGIVHLAGKAHDTKNQSAAEGYFKINTVGPYGESKIKAETYILSREVPADKSVYILRPCMIHGPGNKGNLNLLYNVVRKGIPWPLGAFDNRRTFTSIDNLTFIVERLLEKEVASGIYHMADDEALSTNRLIEIICDSLGRRARIWSIAKPLIAGCAGVGSVLHLPLNRDRLHKLTENYVVSNAKVKRAVGIDRMPVRHHRQAQRTQFS